VFEKYAYLPWSFNKVTVPKMDQDKFTYVIGTLHCAINNSIASLDRTSHLYNKWLPERSNMLNATEFFDKLYKQFTAELTCLTLSIRETNSMISVCQDLIRGNAHIDTCPDMRDNYMFFAKAEQRLARIKAMTLAYEANLVDIRPL
jgi:hypothetical protein